MRKQAQAMSGILGGYKISPLQNRHCPGRHITKITDGCSDDIETGFHEFPLNFMTIMTQLLPLRLNRECHRRIT